MTVPGGRRRRVPPSSRLLVVPGSFDPLHRGHLAVAHAAVATAAARGLGRRTLAFELSVGNVDKQRLDGAEVRRRLTPLRDHGDVLLTDAALFATKAELLPGAVFAIGHDTAARLVDPAYYDDEQHRDEALRTIAAAGCRVAVAGRALDGQRYLDLDDVAVPSAHRALFLAVPGVRVDVSSSQLRGDGQDTAAPGP